VFVPRVATGAYPRQRDRAPASPGRAARLDPARHWRRPMSQGSRGKDAGAGLVLGLVSVPDGLAAGLLAGLSPLAGLYGYLVGTVAGALTTSSVFMTVQATGAMAVLISDVPQVRDGPEAPAALATLGILTGLVMIAAGLLRLGSMLRFVPHAVLTGFINAVAVNIVLGQLASFTGYDSPAGDRLSRALDTVLHVHLLEWRTLVVGTATLGGILLLERTRLGPLGLFVAVVLTSGLTAALGWESVATLNDIADIPASLPAPVLPSLSLTLTLLVPALSLAFVGLIQGAAISQSVPNPDGRYPDVSGDFRGQGIANVTSGLLRGMSGTALVRAAGARSRLANLVAGAVMAVVILLLGELAGYIAMPALAGLLMLVGFRTLKPAQVSMVWRTGATQATVMGATFALTLLIPLQYAVLVGVAISVMLYVARQSNRIKVSRWTFEDGRPFPREEPPPAQLEGGDIVVLNTYGSLFFASAPVFATQLPEVTPQSRGGVVVLRLRGKDELGSTFIQVVTRYARSLNQVGGHLVLAGVGDRVMSQLSDTGALAILGAENVIAATPMLGESVTAGMERARALRDGPTAG
jgi:SulP family sulfate permease